MKPRQAPKAAKGQSLKMLTQHRVPSEQPCCRGKVLLLSTHFLNRYKTIKNKTQTRLYHTRLCKGRGASPATSKVSDAASKFRYSVNDKPEMRNASCSHWKLTQHFILVQVLFIMRTNESKFSVGVGSLIPYHSNKEQ